MGPNIKLEDCLAAFFTNDELKGKDIFCNLIYNNMYSNVVFPCKKVIDSVSIDSLKFQCSIMYCNSVKIFYTLLNNL